VNGRARTWRWSWLAGGLAVLGCNVEPPPPPEEETPAEPGVVETPACLSSALPPRAAALSPRAAGPVPDAEGRLPVLVRTRAGTVTAQGRHPVERAGGRLERQWARAGVAAARLTPAEQERLRADPQVLSVEPDRPVYALQAAPGGPVAQGAFLPGLPAEVTPHLRLTQAPAVWDADGDGVVDPGAPTGQGVRVCVLDSGIDPRHPELARAWTGIGRDFVDDDDSPLDQGKDGTWGGGHGTHVAGILAAQPARGGTLEPGSGLPEGGMVGGAPGVTLLVARVLNTSGNGSTSDVIAALDWCVKQGAQVASLSLGSPESSDAEKDAVQAAVDAGMLVVAASGNSGTGDPATEPPIAFPAGYPAALAVGAVTLERTHPAFSQVGEALSLVAPGVKVPSLAIVGTAPFAELGVASTKPAALEYSSLGEYTGALVDCGRALEGSRCGTGATCAGFVALLERGDITFAEKVQRVMGQGARAVVVVDNVEAEDAGAFTLGSAEAWPPVVAVPLRDGGALRAQLGRPVRVAVRGADYAELTGTSMSTPFVSAVAALVKGAHPSLSPTRLRAILEASAEDLGAPGKDPFYGAGLVRAEEALKRAAAESTPSAGP
jgi:subtilisin family serine protease